MAGEQKPHHQEQEQSPLPPPAKVARLLSSDAEGVVTMASPSPLVLGLDLGLGVGVEAGKPAFTFMQLQELEHQALIYKHMVAGIPVPLHLVLPIWKSVAASFGPHHYPSFVGLGSLCYDFRNSMEPEPGRCRRTDGKKWRCSRDVVPDQKYCERHMHRGRNRSRKPVEAGGGMGVGGGIPAAAVTTNAATPQIQPSSTNLSISIPNSGLQVMPTNNSNSSSSSNSNNVSPPRLGFSPTSVLQSSTTCKTGAS